jgi:PAS domain S-box-containing protein
VVEAVDFRVLFESCPVSFLVLDPQLRIVAVTDAYLTATMAERTEILGRGVFEVFPDNPDDPAAEGVRNLRVSLERVLRERVTDVMPVQRYDVRRSDGSFEQRFWSPSNSPVLDGAGAVRYVIHRVEDVTEFVRLQASRAVRQREAPTQRMEQEVFARANEVAGASRQLKEANAELADLYQRTKQLDELKSQFFANVSHELRTPLTSIQGYVETLLDDPVPDTDTTREFLYIIQRSARRMNRLTEDLLTLAGVESPDYKLFRQPMPASALVDDAVASLGGMVSDAGLQLELDGAPDDLVLADPDALNQIFGNLTENALKYGGSGGRLQIGARRLEKEVEFWVRDFGPGIASEHLGRIFERFYRVDKARSRESGGTGLGLAIVRHIVHAHGGHVRAESELGAGATLYFTLPLAETSAPPAN